MTDLKIGWGSCDITPRGGALSLEGQFETRITSEVRDPLFATAMAVSSGDATCVWVSVDSCHIFKCLTDAVLDALAGRIPGFSPEMLVLGATHIHTGPYHERGGWLSLTGNVEDDADALPCAEVLRQMAAGIANAVVQAVEGMRPSYLELAVAPVITGVNRRVVYADGSAKMYGGIRTPDFRRMEYRDGGPSQLLYVYDARDGRLSGVVANIPCTAQCDEHARYVTADYWATARRILRGVWGEPLPVLALCRAAGDLSPHPMVDRNDDAKPASSAEAARKMGEWVAQFIQWFRGRPLCRVEGKVFLHQSRIVRLPVWSVPPEAYRAAKAYLDCADHYGADGAPRNAFDHANAWTRVRRVETDEKFVDVRLSATRIDGLCLYSAPFELYLAYADRIRAALPGVVPLDVQLTYDNLGYLATREAVAGGHYSANIFNGVCDPEGGEAFVSECVALIRGLFPDKDFCAAR